MALVAWFPFNKTLKNKGCGHLSAELTVASPVYENGITGKNLVLNKTQTNQFIINELKGKNVFACSFWFKFPAKEEHSIKQFTDVITFGIKKKSTGNVATFRLECGDTQNTWVNWYGNGVLTDSGGSIGFHPVPGQWEHMVMIVDGEHFISYHNGKLIQVKNIDSAYKNNYEFTGTVKIGDSTGMYVSLADVRVYDNVLSQKEAREFSKGLIAHYKLESVGGNKNYIVDSSFSKKTDTGLFTFNKNKVVCQATELNQSGNSFGVTLDSNIKADIRGKKLIFSMDYKIETALKFGKTNPWVGYEMSIIFSDNSRQWLDWYGVKTIPTATTNDWVHHFQEVTVQDKEISSVGLIIYFRDTTGKIIFRKPKVEIGEENTPWIPNPADQSYQSYKKIIGTDMSGNDYHCSLVGDLEYQTDTARYINSTFFNGASALKTEDNTFGWFDFNNFTISLWMKPTMKPSGWTGSVGFQVDGGAGAGKIFSISNYSGNFSVQTVNNTSWVTTQSEELPLNQWSHCVATLENGTDLKMYLNGVLVKTGTLNFGDVLVNENTKIVIGVDLPGEDEFFIGNYSDIKFYSTALSGDDILTIYKNSGIIDNERNIYAYEFNEENNLMTYMDCPTSARFFKDTFSQEVVYDDAAPSGKALKLICTEKGTQTGSRGFYLSDGAEAWTRAKAKMVTGKKYKLSLWVKMNRKATGFKLRVECASKENVVDFEVGETYKKLENVFTYDNSAQYSAITSYGAMFEVDDEVYISSLMIEENDKQLKIDKRGVWTQDFIETEENFLEEDANFITTNDSVFTTASNENFILGSDECIPLEYIENTASSWIDSLYIPNKDTGIELDFQYTAVSLQNRLLGIRADSNIEGLFCYDFYINGGGQWAFAYNDKVGNWIASGKAHDLNRHLLRFNYRNNHYSLDNFKTASKEITGSTSNTNTTWTLPIMAGRCVTSTSTSTVDRFSKMKIYSLKIYEKNILQRNFVPCKRVSDNTIGLYETITKHFFGNAGTGTLVAGPEVMMNSKMINNDTQVRVYNTGELTCQEMIEI